MSHNPEVICHFHQDTNTCTFIAYDKDTKEAVVIDPVLDFDPISGKLTDTHNKLILKTLEENGLKAKYIMDTHVHADHITGAGQLRKILNIPYVISKQIVKVQGIFAEKFQYKDFKCDGSQFDHLVGEDDVFKLGNLDIKFFDTPGHAPSLSIYIGDAVFTGDVIFMPDFGTARCDFPGGSPSVLFHSIHKLFSLPDETRVFVGHDYPPKDGSRSEMWETTIGEEKEKNKHVGGKVSEEEFVAMRDERDKTLKNPRLLFQSVQMNINAGEPYVVEDGHAYVKIPLTLDYEH